MQMLTAADKSNIRVAIRDMADTLRKIKTLQEDVKENAKGLAEKYKNPEDPTINAALFTKMAKLELDKDTVVEKQEKAQSPYDYFSLIMADEG